MCSTVMPTFRRSLMSYATTLHSTPISRWIPCAEVETVTALLELRDSTTDFECRVTYQLAETDTDSPGSWAEVSSKSKLAADGYAFSTTTDLSTGTDANTWIRFGIGVLSAGTAAPERGEVLVTMAYRC